MPAKKMWAVPLPAAGWDAGKNGNLLPSDDRLKNSFIILTLTSRRVGAFAGNPQAGLNGGYASLCADPRFTQPHSGMQQALADCIAHQARHFMDVKLFHDVVAMGFRRLETDIEQPGNLFRGVSLRDQLQDLALARSQWICSLVGTFQDGVHDRRSHARAEIRLATEDFANRANQILGRLGL